MDLELLLDVMGCKTRRDILDLLRDEPRFVSQISRELEIGQKAIIEPIAHPKNKSPRLSLICSPCSRQLK